MNYKKSKEEDTFFFSGDIKIKKKLFKLSKKESPFNKLLSLNIK